MSAEMEGLHTKKGCVFHDKLKALKRSNLVVPVDFLGSVGL